MSGYNHTPYIDIHTHTQGDDRVTIRAIGTHPWCAKSGAELPEAEVGVEAIGEIGLDFCSDISQEIQTELFTRELARAVELNLPVVIHSVRSMDKIIENIDILRPRDVIIHGFIGSKELMQRALNRGYYISFGERTLRSAKTIEALRMIPRDRLFFESDTSTTPIEQIYQKLCEVMGESVEQIRESIYSNYIRIFR